MSLNSTLHTRHATGLFGLVAACAIGAGFLIPGGIARGQLILGNDQATPTIWVTDVAGVGAPRPLVTGANARVYGLAADNTGAVLYWLDGGAALYKAAYAATGPLTPVLVGATTVSGATVAFVSLAYDSADQKLFGYRNSNDAATEGVYELNTINATAVRVGAIDPLADFGGLDYDGATDAFYGNNDGAGAFAGRGVYRIAKPLTAPVVTLIAAYPGSESDIDGLAAGNGRLYLVNDVPSEGVYVLNLTTRQYEPTLPGPFMGAGTFCGGAWAPGLFIPPAGADLSVTLIDSADCSVAVGGIVRYTATAANAGPNSPENVVIEFRFPLQAEYVASTPAGVVVVGMTNQTLTIPLGPLRAGTSVGVPIEIRALPQPMGGLIFDAGAAIRSELMDQNGANNNASQTTRLVTSIPAAAAARGIVSTIATSLTSLVPGGDGIRFSDAVIPGRPVRSPGGNRWLQSWDTDASDTMADHVLIASDLASIAVVAREGVSPQIPAQQGGDLQPPPYFPFGAFDPAYGINDAGDVIFSGIDSHDGTLNDGYVVKIVGGVLSQLVQERTTVAPAATGGLRFGASPGGATPSRSACAIAPDGGAAFMHAIEGVPADRAQFVFRAGGGAIVARAGVTVPLDQASGEMAVVREFDACAASLGVYFNADHSRMIASCTLNTNAARDRAVVVDGRVVAQEGSALPGDVLPSIVASDGIRTVRMEHNGAWFVRGSNVSGKDWVIRNGILEAASGEGIVRGSAEQYTDAANPACFSLALSNSRRDVLIAGATDAPDPKTRQVAVLNGRTIVARANDPVDLDANGVFDDGMFIKSFLDDRAFLTNSSLFVTVRLRGALAALCGGEDLDAGLALVRIPFPPPPCVADIDDGSGMGVPDLGVTIEDLLYYLAVYGRGSLEADIDDGTGSGIPDDGVTIDDLLFFLVRFEAGC